MYIVGVGNGRYISGQTITPTTPFLDGNGSAVTGLIFTVQTNDSSGSIKVQGDLFDKNDSTGTAGQVLSSTGTGNGVDWITVNAGGTVTEVDAGIGLLTSPSSGITTTGSVSLRYVQTNEPTVNNFIDAATEQTAPQTADYIIYSDQTGANQVYKAQIAELPFNNYVLPLAASGTRGGIKIGYPENGQNYPVELDNEQAYVNVPWTAGTFTLLPATTSNLGGVLIGFTKNQSARNYPLEITTTGTLYQAFVNIDVMTAATSGTGGLPGLVPSSVAGDQLKFLRGDATWQTITGGGTNVVANPGSGETVLSTITIGTTNYSVGFAEPGIFSGGGTPTLATGVTSAEIRTLIGAGTGNVTNGGASENFVPIFSTAETSGNPVSITDSLIQKGTNRMSITAANNVAKTNKSSGVLFLENTTTTNNSTVLTLATVAESEDPPFTPTFISFFNGTANNGGIHAVGATSVNFYAGSDYRLKQNVKDYKKGLHNISNLRPVTYQMKSHPDETVRGFIAHEVEDYIPSAVQGVKDGVDKNGEDIMQTLSQGEFITDIVSAIKELKNEVDSLKAEIKSLQK
jgi:hypothetical protein